MLMNTKNAYGLLNKNMFCALCLVYSIIYTVS